MTTSYTAIIEEQSRKIVGMDADGKYLLAGGEELWIKPLKISTSARARRLKRISKLTFTGGEWLLDGENLKCRYFDATTKSHESSGEARTEAATTFRLLEVLEGVSDEDRPEINGVAWFDEGFDAIEGETAEMCAVTNDDLDALAGVGSHVKRRPLPPAKEFRPVLLADFQISPRHGQHVMASEVAVQKLTSERKRIEAASDQLGAHAKALTEAIAPLANLYSKVELAEIRKRAVGKGIPDYFVDWVMVQFQTSNPPKLPTKGDAFNNCGPNTVIGKKLAAACFGISKQRFADHLTVLRRLLEEKGWLAPRGSDKSRKRESNFQPDDRLEDYNQPNPAESAGDRDEERWKAAGLDDEHKRSGESDAD